MELRAEHITIAVTVYSRRDFVLEAIHSALDQTVPVKVIVVEDCGPDAALRDMVVGEFGGQIEYFRNAKNRGLFDNWNACMEYCGTPWLSILHDDDLLRPNFVETILALAKEAPGRALYLGRAAGLDEAGQISHEPSDSWGKNWRDVDVIELADAMIVPFSGNLFCVANARAIGGFRKASYYAGDWDMWFRLALRFGAAQSAMEVSVVRSHSGGDRGTTCVERKGWKWVLASVQRKRNLALLRRERGIVIPFDRVKLLEQNPIPSRLLFQHAGGFSKRMRAYNWWLFTQSKPPHFRYAVLQRLVRLFGPRALWIGSVLLRRLL
jgi:glycosyltransferase involved in cell wall biosynthesis